MNRKLGGVDNGKKTGCKRGANYIPFCVLQHCHHHCAWQQIGPCLSAQNGDPPTQTAAARLEVRDLQGPSVFVSDPHFAYGVTNIQSWNVDEWTLVTVHGGTTDQNIGYDVAKVSPWGTAHRGA